ncbi:MAG: PAS domain S-box protein [Ghiorsea sp.]|nr:PAS domain S-box protein [Ghiorsea sp.]
MLIRDIMISPALSIPPNTPLNQVADIMAEKRIGFIIIAEDNRAIGVLSEGNMVHFAASGVDLKSQTAAEHMTSPVFSVPIDANAFYAYDELIARKMRHLVVEDEHGFLAGVVTMSCFIANLGVEHFTDLQTVAEIIQPIHATVTPDTPIVEAAQLMAKHKHALIALEDGKPVGLLSSRGITRLCQESKDLSQFCVRDMMIAPNTINRKAFVPEASVVMKANRTRHLIVVGDQGEFAGLLTISDVAYSMEGKYVEFMRSVMRDMEHDLITTSRHHKALFERNPNAVFSLDTEGVITNVNPACILLTGHGSDYLVGKSLDTFIDPDIKEEAHISFLSAKAGNAESQHLRLISGDGSVIYVFMTFVPVQVDGVPQAIYAVAYDITERILAEQRLYRLSQALQQAGEPIAITDAYGVIEFSNRKMDQLFGYAESELISQHLAKLECHTLPEQPTYKDTVWQVLEQGLPYKGEFLHQHKDGEVLDLKVSCAPVHVPGAEKTAYYIIIFEDMRERRRAEKNAMQSQKLETIGTLAGGIAHDFNNYLAAVSGSLYMLKHEINHLPNACERLSKLERLTDRAASLVSQLLTYARKDSSSNEFISMSELVHETKELVHTLIPKGIELQWKVAKHISIMGNTTQIQQVLLNLVTNAKDAVANKSEPIISINLKSYTPNANDAKNLHLNEQQKYAVLSVSDNGCGIDDAHRAEIFDPFFTTKSIHEGTGMGLAMTYGAIQSHHGVIDVESKLGQGSTFNVYLPLASDPKVNNVDKESDKPLILFADDDEMVHEIGIEIIESLGYRVQAAFNGEDALNLFQQDPDSFSAAVLDVMMPRMGGVDTAKKIRQITPNFPILFLTGYDKELISTQVLAEPNISMHKKPWKVEDVEPTLRQLITQTV